MQQTSATKAQLSELKQTVSMHKSSSSFELDVVLCSVLCYALSYHSTQKLLWLHVFCQAGLPQRVGRLLGPKVGNSIKCLSQGHSDTLPHWKSNQSFATFWLLARRLYQLSHVTKCTNELADCRSHKKIKTTTI